MRRPKSERRKVPDAPVGVAESIHRIAVIGNAGGGKSLWSIRVGRQLNTPVLGIDNIQWLPGWQPAPLEQLRDTHRQWLLRERWIIDGWGPWEEIERRFRRAQLIVFVDFPLALHYWWAVKRQVEAALHLRTDWPPPGCDPRSVTLRMLRTIRRVDREFIPRLRVLLAEDGIAPRVVRVQSPRQLRALERRLSGSGSASGPSRHGA